MISSFRFLLPLAMLAITIPLSSQKISKTVPARLSSALIERGKYLVERTGMCQDCHTPMNEKGEPIRNRWLAGASIPFKPTVPMPWAEQSPRIAGLPGWSDEDAIRFLTTGQTPTGVPPRPPMPGYRYSREDAKAITAYLRSLGKTDHSAAK